VIACLSYLFSIFGIPAYIHSDRGAAFLCQKLISFLCTQAIATSSKTPYSPTRNGQVERYNRIIWNTIQLAKMTRGLKLEQRFHSVIAMYCYQFYTTRTTFCSPPELFKIWWNTSIMAQLPRESFYKKTCTCFIIVRAISGRSVFSRSKA